MKAFNTFAMLALAVFLSSQTMGATAYFRSRSCAEKPAQASASVDIQVEREGATVALSVEKQKTILSVTGVDRGSAILTRTGERWPDLLVIRVYLSGLEQLTITAGELKLSASVLSHGTHQRLLHLWKNKEEGPPLTKESPYWMEIAIYNAQGKPIQKLPAKGGWFEMTIPAAMLTDPNKTIRLGWLAFFL